MAEFVEFNFEIQALYLLSERYLGNEHKKAEI